MDPVVVLPRLEENGMAQYVSLPPTLMFDHHPYSAERLREFQTQQEAYGTNERREYPWRVVRWRDHAPLEGLETEQQSNARVVTFEDGSQFLYIGDDTVYQVEKKHISRGVNDFFSMASDTTMAHFASISDRYYFKLVREPKALKSTQVKTKARKVRLVKAKSKKEEQQEEAQDRQVKAEKELKKVQNRKARQVNAAPLNKEFLEDGFGGGKDQYEANEFLDDDAEPDEEDASRSKRARQAVDEDRILQAKRAPAPKRAKEDKPDDDLEIYDDSFIDDEDDEEDDGGRAGVIDSDSD